MVEMVEGKDDPDNENLGYDAILICVAPSLLNRFSPRAGLPMKVPDPF